MVSLVSSARAFFLGGASTCCAGVFGFTALWASSSALAQDAERAAELPTGYGAALLQGVVSLLAVCLLAWLVLRVLGKNGFGRGDGKRMRIIDRLSLDARNQLYLVEVEGERYLVSASGQSAPRLIEALGPADNSSLETTPLETTSRDTSLNTTPSRRSFQDALLGTKANKKAPGNKPGAIFAEDE